MYPTYQASAWFSVVPVLPAPGWIAVERPRAGAVERVRPEHLVHLPGDPVRKRALGLRLAPTGGAIDLAAGKHHLRDRHRAGVDAARGERRVGGRHLERAHRERPEPDRSDRLLRQLDTEALGHAPDVVGADVERELRVDGVVRGERRRGERHRSRVAMAVRRDLPRVAGGVVALAPRPARTRERRRGVVGRVGVRALLDRRGEHECLERRAGLPRRLGGEVELVLRVAGDHGGHRANRAGARLDRHDRGGRIVRLVQDLRDRALRCALEPRLDRRVDTQSALAHRVRAVDALELLGHVGEEVGLLDVRIDLARLQHHPLLDGAAELLARDLARLEHGPEHVVSTRDRRLPVVERVVDRRRLRQPGEQRGLGERQVTRVPREVGLRRGLDPVGVVAVVDRVQVLAQDHVLRPASAQLDREARLLDLALERTFVAGVEVGGELLGDRRAALDHLAGAHVTPEGADDALVVDAAVLVEAAVLDRDRRLRQPRADPRRAGRARGSSRPGSSRAGCRRRRRRTSSGRSRPAAGPRGRSSS